MISNMENRWKKLVEKKIGQPEASDEAQAAASPSKTEQPGRQRTPNGHWHGSVQYDKPIEKRSVLFFSWQAKIDKVR